MTGSWGLCERGGGILSLHVGRVWAFESVGFRITDKIKEMR